MSQALDRHDDGIIIGAGHRGLVLGADLACAGGAAPAATNPAA